VFDKELFRKDPRDYALSLVDDGLMDARAMLHLAVIYMSHDDVRDMLDCNELSPRFDDDADEKDTDETEEG
jgi:hypothetical protein